MSRDHQHVVDLQAQRAAPDPRRALWLGTLLQFGLRAVLIVFVVATLLWEPGTHDHWICAAVVAVYVIVIAVSRPVLGVHFPTDVLAGAALGIGWTLLCASLLKPWQD